LVFIIIDLGDYTFSISKSEYFVNFIGLFTKYSVLYSSTFIIAATYYAINQLIESKNSNTTALKQANISIKDIESKIERETSNKVVEECRYFYDKIQPSIKDLYIKLSKSNLIFGGFSWEINDFTEEDIHSQDPKWMPLFDLLQKSDQILYSEIILAINKLEVFSISFVDGIADLEKGYKAVGYAYCRQVENIYPLVSVWRSRARDYDKNFYNKTIELYNEWNRTKN